MTDMRHWVGEFPQVSVEVVHRLGRWWPKSGNPVRIGQGDRAGRTSPDTRVDVTGRRDRQREAAVRTATLGPAQRAESLAAMAERELDVLVVGARRGRRGHRAGRRDARPVHRPGRGAGLGVGHVEQVQQADPRRPALSGDARLRARPGGAEGARAAAGAARAAPGEAGAVPLPAPAPGLGAAVRGVGRRALRRDVDGPRARPRPARAPSPDAAVTPCGSRPP